MSEIEIKRERGSERERGGRGEMCAGKCESLERGARKEGERALVRGSRSDREREKANECALSSVQNHLIPALTL